MYYFFFFYCYGAHRELHVLTPSVPTRRSSDLASIAVMPAKAGIHDPIRKRTGCLAREIDPSLRWGDETGNDRFPPHAVPGDFDAYPNTRASDRSSIIN